MNLIKRFSAAFLGAVFIVCSIQADAYATAQNADKYEQYSYSAYCYVRDRLTNPTISTVGGEWAIVGLAAMNAAENNDIFNTYLKNVTAVLSEKNGVLHKSKYTEYSRVIIALSAIGANAQDISGYNLVSFPEDFEKTVSQGANGAIWALTALDCRTTWDTRLNQNIDTLKQDYIDYILSCQASDGGFSLIKGGNPSADVTAMAITSLAPYRNEKTAESSIAKAVSFLSEMQTATGGFNDNGTPTCESVSQVIIALSSLGIPLDDARFVKNGYSALDNLLSFQTENGGFRHTPNSKAEDMMASEQALLAISAFNRCKNGLSPLFSFDGTQGLNPIDTQNIDEIVNIPPILNKNISFNDISECSSMSEIIELAQRNIITGFSGSSFHPDDTMTRAQFCTAIVKALGLPLTDENYFSDIYKADWYCRFVNTAYKYGIISGTADQIFTPDGNVTREQAAVIICNAARLLAAQKEISRAEAVNLLSEFTDYIKISDWAFSQTAFCFKTGIFSYDTMEFDPKSPVLRHQAAQMIYRLISLHY